MTDIVKLDVGGTVFKTTKSTLTKFDGFFRTMFETPVPVPKDESGAIFIDRSPEHFEVVLNFMRAGYVDLQKYSGDVREIQKEAEFYLLEGLVELCISKTKSQKLPCFAETEEEMVIAVVNSTKPVVCAVSFKADDGDDRNLMIRLRLIMLYGDKIDFCFKQQKCMDQSSTKPQGPPFHKIVIHDKKLKKVWHDFSAHDLEWCIKHFIPGIDNY
ncbi:unnamed protein product [Caenorhabditis nigoni]|uniref:BTB domain-containing protein n=1 Tax=Caenorhabditis nigoni TaxID=1611254 RepID=A0A2G5VBS7_9PELO|nr:hypothetical protein B9Z55_007895 [Caenorhabditis nigoni]